MLSSTPFKNYPFSSSHESLRRQPEAHVVQLGDASLRVTTQFLELLEGQFPVEKLNAPLRLKTAQDYANRLS